MIKDKKVTELAIRQECDRVRQSIDQDQSELNAIDEQRFVLLQRLEAKRAHLRKWEDLVDSDPVRATRTKRK